MSAKTETRIGRCAHATKLLTQCHIPVRHTPSVDCIVRPHSVSIDVQRVVIEVVHIDHGDVAGRPIKGTEEKSRTKADSNAPREPESRTVEIARPRSPIHRRIRWPPPGSV